MNGFPRQVLVVLAVWLTALPGWALEPPAFTELVVDRARVLSPADKDRVTARLEAFNAAVTGQMAVLVVPSLQGDPIEDFSIRTVETWKLGKKGTDRGLLLLIALEDRAVRIEVGDGFEGDINDARAGDVIRAMMQAFRESRYADGIIGAIGQLEGFIGPGSASAVAPSESREQQGPSWPGIVIVCVFILFFILASRFGRRLGPPGPGGGFGRGGFGGGGGGGGFSGGGGGRFSGGGASGKW